MPRTNLERRLAYKHGEGIIVPILNKLLEEPVGIDDGWDVEFLKKLAEKQVIREQERAKSYTDGKTVFSPSSLASCLRRSYLSKNHREHGLTRVETRAIEPHYYFLTGDFIHLKVQFMLYKASMKWPEKILLVDSEMPVMSKRGDHGGTVDVLVFVDGEPFIVDVKGVNIRTFSAIDKGEPPHAYRIQVADYTMLFNAMIQRGAWKPSNDLMEYLSQWGHVSMPKVKRGVLLAENKGGPDMAHPAAFTEQIIDLKENLPELRIRMEALRGFEEEKEIPEAECESTRYIEFTGCPFSEFCRPEVKQREAARVAAEEAKGYRLARPKRRRRTRRS